LGNEASRQALFVAMDAGVIGFVDWERAKAIGLDIVQAKLRGIRGAGGHERDYRYAAKFLGADPGNQTEKNCFRGKSWVPRGPPFGCDFSKWTCGSLTSFFSNSVDGETSMVSPGRRRMLRTAWASEGITLPRKPACRMVGGDGVSHHGIPHRISFGEETLGMFAAVGSVDNAHPLCWSPRLRGARVASK